MLKKLNSMFPFISSICLSLCLIIQQYTLNNHTAAINDINRSMVVPLSYKPTQNPPYIEKTSILTAYQNAIYSTYRVSYFFGESSESASGFSGIGSAFAVSSTVLQSCAHLFSHDPDITHYRLDIHNRDGVLVNSVPFKLEKISGTTDLTKLIVETPLPYFNGFESIENFNNLQVGDDLLIIGASNGGVPYHVVRAQLSSKSCEFFPNLYQASGVIAGGHSGGCVVNPKTMKVVGVLVRGGSNIALFVPLPIINEFLAG